MQVSLASRKVGRLARTSCRLFGLRLRRSIDSRAYTLPVVLIAAMAVWSLKTLKVIGS